MLKKLIFTGIVIAATGCPSATVQAPPPAACTGIYCGAPDWVRKGSGAFGGDQGKAFYGVGPAANIQMESLRRVTAEANARAEIAKIMDTYVANLLKQYQESASNGQANQEVQMVQNTLKTFTQQELHGAEIIDHWISNDGSTEFALCRLDFGAFANDMNQVKQLNDRAREVIKARADQAFDELGKEEAKHSGQ